MKEQIVKFNGYSIIHLEMLKIENQTLKKNEEGLSLETETYENSKDKKVHKLLMKLNTITYQAEINLEIEGYFEFNETFNKAEISRFLKVNGAAILYPYCRAIISNITGLDSNQNILLPVLNFANINKE